MTFEVEVGGRVRTVSVERTDRPARLRVTLDGASSVLDVVRTGEYGFSLMRTVSRTGGPEKGTVARAGERAMDLPVPLWAHLQVTPGGAPGELLVSLGGRVIAATVNGRRSGRRADAAAEGTGEVSIVAAMAGRVVRVLVAPGDDVAARQALVVVEAMKMENELRAPRAGRVKGISVAPGTSVEAGRVLAILE